jgi:ABC-type Fe3+-siderophore transport system permease subunit
MQKIIQFNKTYFLPTIFLFVIEIIIAKYVHDDIVRPYIGDMLVVILIYCFVKSFFKTDILKMAVAVLLFSYFIEFLQYLKIVQILGLQQYKIARIIVGTSFSWEDILMYTLGVIIVLIIERKKMPSS